jgi:beta-barrel assembly-enhancing protease
MKKLSLLIILISTAFLTMQCDKNNEVHLFGIQTDKDFGAQTDSAINADPAQFPLIKRSENPQAYAYLDGIVNKILNSGKVVYKDEFAWEVNIIKDDNTLNAFATPGGYIYVYTGLIKYLDKEDDLAGVLGHEIAHADKRHSISQIEKTQGLALITSIILGKDPGALQQIIGQLTGQLAGLQFSRSDEKEADDYSVVYLAETEYACNGAYSFFQKMIEEKQTGNTPEILSTHPNPESRVEDINKKADELKCDKTALDPATYEGFKAML